VHTALSWQVATFCTKKHGYDGDPYPAHESVSVHRVPSPLKLALQVQLCRPGPSWLHVALGSQSFSLTSSHGNISAQVPPVKVYSVLQTQAYEMGPVSLHVPIAAAPHGSPAQSSMSSTSRRPRCSRRGSRHR
jgi:hypothetical protein